MSKKVFQGRYDNEKMEQMAPEEYEERCRIETKNGGISLTEAKVQHGRRVHRRVLREEFLMDWKLGPQTNCADCNKQIKLVKGQQQLCLDCCYQRRRKRAILGLTHPRNH